MRRLIAILLLGFAGLGRAAPGLGPLESRYSVAWGSTALGDAVVTLTPLAEKGCYRYESVTQPIALVRWVYGSPRETSLYCVRDGEVRVSHFEYVNDKRAKDNFTLDFDWSARKVKMLKRGVVSERELPPLAYDRFAIQRAVRDWVLANLDKKPEPREFVMVDDGRIVTYKFAVIGTENVETPTGTFETLRVERIDNPNKTIRSWLAPKLDYEPVKIERIENGEVKMRMLLK